jgi:hypothetical protein
MKRILATGACLALAQLLGACSTVRGDFHQNLQIDALDSRNHSVEGMQCQIGSGSSAKTFATPATNVRVHRAMASLEIECRLDSLVATATVRARRERMEEALLPFGSVGVFVDHLSGSLYAYPTTLHLRVGQHVVLEHGGDAQVASTEALPGASQLATGSTQRIEVASIQPTAAVPATARTAAAAPAPGKPAAAAAKTNRAVTKPVKAASATPATTKPKAAPSKATVAVTAGAAGTAAAAVHSAPVNW